ncbi:MAG: hypothetical protein LBL83_00860 [Clostridiales bacterium]|jgi:hypothetical protein|nr:hypothetical protein [Clostridiales bacterium]
MDLFCILGIDGQLLFRGHVREFAFTDQLIVQKSIEFFNDDAPCFIHRGAVVSRLHLEIEALLDSAFGEAQEARAAKGGPRGALAGVGLPATGEASQDRTEGLADEAERSPDGVELPAPDVFSACPSYLGAYPEASLIIKEGLRP